MSRVRIRPIVGNALVATTVTNVAWTYLTWRYRLGIGTIYVCPWVLITTLWYGYRAQRLGLYSGRLGAIAYDFRSIRVAALPFLGAVVLPLLNFAVSSQAPGKSPPVVIVVSGVSWYLNDLISIFSREVLKIPQSFADPS